MSATKKNTHPVGLTVRINQKLKYLMKDSRLGLNNVMLKYANMLAKVVYSTPDSHFVKLDVDNEKWWWHKDILCPYGDMPDAK